MIVDLNQLPLGHRASLAVLILAAVLAGCSPASSIDEATQSSEALQAASDDATLHRPGEQIRLGDLGVVIQPAEIRPRVGLVIAPEAAAQGGELVLVRCSISNLGTKPISAASLPDITLVDDKGVQYAPDAGKTGAYALASELDDKVFSDLNPGITVQNAGVFEVSKTAFNPATWTAVIAGRRIALR